MKRWTSLMSFYLSLTAHPVDTHWTIIQILFQKITFFPASKLRYPHFLKIKWYLKKDFQLTSIQVHSFRFRINTKDTENLQLPFENLILPNICWKNFSILAHCAWTVKEEKTGAKTQWFAFWSVVFVNRVEDSIIVSQATRKNFNDF